MSQEEYQGRHFEDQSPSPAPPRPESYDAGRPTPQGGAGTYARVRFMGRWGALCSQHQTFEQFGITLEEARDIAFDRFGVCPHEITCFDAQGNVVHQE